MSIFDFRDLEEKPLTTRSGLEAFYHQDRTQPALITADTYNSCSRQERDAYNERRLGYIFKGLTVTTPAYLDARSKLKQLIAYNRLAPDRHPLGISGDPSGGKTHLVATLVEGLVNSYVRQVPDFLSTDRVPVIIINVPPETNPKGVLREIISALEFGVAVSDTMDRLQRIVTGFMRDHGTIAIVFDEAQNMAGSTAKVEGASLRVNPSKSAPIRLTPRRPPAALAPVPCSPGAAPRACGMPGGCACAARRRSTAWSGSGRSRRG